MKRCPPKWLFDYINDILPPTAPLHEVDYDSLHLLLTDNPDTACNILTKVTKLSLSQLPRIPNWPPSNIVDLSLGQLHLVNELNLSMVKRLSVIEPLSAGELAVYSCTSLKELDVAFDGGFPVRRLQFPVLRSLRVRGKNYEPLSDIDAPKLQALFIDATYASQENPARDSLERAVRSQKYTLRPASELEVRIVVSVQTLGILLDRSPALEKLRIHMSSRDADTEQEELHHLLHSPISIDRDNYQTSQGQAAQRANFQQESASSSSKDDGGEARIKRLRSLTIVLENIWIEEKGLTWERELR